MLREIPGERLRRQYFNIPIYLLLSMYSGILSGCIAIGIREQTLCTPQWFTEVLPWGVIGGAILLPFVILAVLNRFCFGELICVLNEKGLYYMDGDSRRCIDWRDIKTVVYEPDLPNKDCWRHGCFNTAYVTVKPFKKEIEHELTHAPFALLRKMKRYAPNATYGFTKTGLILVLCIALAPSVMFALAILFS